MIDVLLNINEKVLGKVCALLTENKKVNLFSTTAKINLK